MEDWMLAFPTRLYISIEPCPKGLPQRAFEDLAGILARQVSGELDSFGHLVAGHPTAAISLHVGHAERAARLQLDVSAHRLAKFLIGYTEHAAIGHFRQLVQLSLDFRRIDVGAARNNHVLGASAQIKKPITIEIANVARGDHAEFFRRLSLGIIPVIS